MYYAVHQLSENDDKHLGSQSKMIERHKNFQTVS